jgi:hypothetical protein
MNNSTDVIRAFGMSTYLIPVELLAIEKEFDIALGHIAKGTDAQETDYYPQFEQSVRAEASQMAAHYEVFYCLEKAIRRLVIETLANSYGEGWWDSRVPEKIRENVRHNIQREIDSGVTLRSESNIDFTTFGELGEIVRMNWVSFDAMFSSEKAFTKIMTALNQLRGPIAHCCPLADDEVVRLRLTVRDWFRLME